MRTLFIALCKVFGLWSFFQGIVYVTQAIPVMLMLGSHADITVSIQAMGSAFTVSVLSASLGILLAAAVAWILIFRSEWLADTLQIKDTTDQSPVNAETILSAGIRFIGLIVIIRAAPELLIKAGQMIFVIQDLVRINEHFVPGIITQSFVTQFLSNVLAPLLKLAMGCLLAFRADYVLEKIYKPKPLEAPQN